MLFQDVIGQEEVKLHLAEMVQQNRLSHALLFLAKAGSGGLPLAVAFAQYIVCERANPKSSAPSLFDAAPAPTAAILTDACGECPACTKARQMVHPDIHFSFPVIPKKSGDKPRSSDYITEWREFFTQQPYGTAYEWLQFIGAENRQGNITAEECNDIIRQLSLKSFESEYKILVMWLPEYLGQQGNKLLKLIEEPPANTVFILVAEKEELILQTILSRTQLVKIPLLSQASIEQALISRHQVDEEQARTVARMAEGSYHEAVQLLQHSSEDWLSLLRGWLNATIKAGQAAQVKWVDEAASLGREKQKQFLQFFNHLLEQCIRLRVMGLDHTTLSEQELDFAQKINKISSVPQQQAIIAQLDNATYFIERNANTKMLFLALTIKMMHILRNKTVVSAN